MGSGNFFKNCFAFGTIVRLKRLHTYQFISIRSLLPLVLAQLLIQFQKPIVVAEHALAVNGSHPLLMTDTTSQLSNDSNVAAAAHRSVRAVDEPFSIDEKENSIHSANLFAPDYSIGTCLLPATLAIIHAN